MHNSPQDPPDSKVTVKGGEMNLQDPEDIRLSPEDPQDFGKMHRAFRILRAVKSV